MEGVPFFLDISVCCFWSEIRASPSRCALIQFHFSICLLAYLSTVKQIYEFQFTLWNRSDSQTCLFVYLFIHSFTPSQISTHSRNLWNSSHMYLVHSLKLVSLLGSFLCHFLRWSSFLNLVFLFGLSFTWTLRNVHRNRILLEVPKFSLSFSPRFRARSLTATLILFSGSKFGF